MDARGRAALAALLAPLITLGCGPDPAEVQAPQAAAPAAQTPAHPATEPAPWFVECATARGIDFEHVCAARHRFWSPEIICGGTALFDADGDGDLDLFLVQGGDLAGEGEPTGNRLYRNRGDGFFEDKSEQLGVASGGYGMGVACGDYDNDGDVDVFVTNVGKNQLLQNSGDGTFTDVTDLAGFTEERWSAGAAFTDYDGDGWLDLFVANYIGWSPEREMECHLRPGVRDYCSPTRYDAPEVSSLYHNRGDGTFEDKSDSSGIRAARGNGLGVACADFDGDGRIDIYVANDLTPNHLWINLGEGRFAERALTMSCALTDTGGAASGMGVQAFDLEGDGKLEILVTNLRRQGHSLYSWNGKTFDVTSKRSGLFAASSGFTSFGVGMHDFDHDGDLDAYIANGQVMLEEPYPNPADPYAQVNLLLEQDSPGHFRTVAPPGGTAQELVHASRAAAFGDVDADGDVDVVVTNRDARPYLLLGRGSLRGHWVMFRVLEEHGRDAVGAAVTLRAGARVQRRLVDPAYGYCASNDPRVHFGLGSSSRIDEVRVRWPNGRERVWSALKADQLHVLEPE